MADLDKAHILQRAVRLLDCFTQDHPSLGVREVARMLAVSSSAAGRMMVTLKELGVLTQDPVTKQYSLGPRSLTWAGIYLATSDLHNIAYPYLQDLHEITRETISLYVLEGSERVCIERLESTQNIRFVAPRIGRRLPLHAGSAGKVLLAYLDENRIEDLINSGNLARLTEKTMVDPATLREELTKIKTQGYALSNGEWILDAAGVAAPIFDRTGEVLAALTISGPSQRFTQEVCLGYIGHAMKFARLISNKMGFRGEPNP